MEDILKDKRFAHITKDPKFRRIPKSARKIKIDKRFQSMFTDKKFNIKYTVDKRGRPINQTSAENLRKYYDISSSEEDDSDSHKSDSFEKKEKVKSSTSKKTKKIKKTKSQETETAGSEENNDANYSSNGKLLLVKQSTENSIDYGSESKESSENEKEDDELRENEKQLKIKKNNEKELDDNVKKKLRDLTVDYARGEGILFSDSSSEEESSENEHEEEEIEHNWGELDKDAETIDESTCRLAALNMDWDRIRAVDLMVLFNSFLPTGGLIHSVTIYPSEFGLKRIKEEELKGPIELVESDKSDNDEKEDNKDDENEEGSSYSMEKLRQYQLNRLKYYYAVIVFDSAGTANKIYTECDGLEYESSATKLDLRFIPDDVTFDEEPKEICNTLPDLTKYTPRLFTTTALQQVKVDLTWDETNPEREELTKKLNSGKLEDLNDNDIYAYLNNEVTVSSGEENVESETEDEVKKQLEKVNDANDNEDPINKYKSLLKSIEQAEEEKKKKDVELEFTWSLGEKEKTEKLLKEKMKQKETLTPFQQYLEKRKAKKKAKREQKKLSRENNDDTQSDSEDSIPSDIDMNDPYFAEEMKNLKPTLKKEIHFINNDSDENVDKRKKAELELLLMDDDESNKRHFSMKRIEEAEALTKSKKKRLNKKKQELKAEAIEDDFKVDVEDPRFTALFTSHLYNIDPSHPSYRKTKATEALINEKLKRRHESNTNNDIIEKKQKTKEQNKMGSKVNAEINSLIKSIKRNTENIKKSKK